MGADFQDRTSDTARVLVEIEAERTRQDLKWGQQNHPDGTGPRVAIAGRIAHAADLAVDARLSCQASARRGQVTWRHIIREELYEARAEITEIKNNRLVSAIFGHRKGAPKPFCLYRRQDVSGVSGTGVVAVGCEFPDGLVVLRWTSAWPTSVVFHERGIESVKAIHGHDGRTEVVWLSDQFESLAEMEQRLELVEAHRDSLLVLETAARAFAAALAEADEDDDWDEDPWPELIHAIVAAVDSLPPKPDTPEGDRG